VLSGILSANGRYLLHSGVSDFEGVSADSSISFCGIRRSKDGESFKIQSQETDVGSNFLNLIAEGVGSRGVHGWEAGVFNVGVVLVDGGRGGRHLEQAANSEPRSAVSTGDTSISRAITARIASSIAVGRRS